jgi:hypothetical protein
LKRPSKYPEQKMKRPTGRHINVKFQKTEDEEKMLKVSRKEKKNKTKNMKDETVMTSMVILEQALQNEEIMNVDLEFYSLANTETVRIKLRCFRKPFPLKKLLE